MARRTATPALSPRMLKHFAAATVVLTGTLAVFASGEDWGAQAQVQAVEAKNQLAATEAEKLGTKKVVTTLKIANGVGTGSFGNDEPENFGGGGGGGYAPAVQPQVQPTPSTSALRKPQSKFSADPFDPTRPPMPPGSEQQSAQAHSGAPPAPSAQDIANITASSAQRSGGGGGD